MPRSLLPHTTGEISIVTNEILTVTNQDIGEGWYQGSNSKGEVGLFPAGYVEEIPETASRPTSGTFQSPTNQFNNQQQFAAQQGIFATQTSYSAPNADQSATTTAEYYDDNWDDDEWSVIALCLF